MTLPETNILPLRQDFEKWDDLNKYLRELVFELTERDVQVAEAVNGYIKANAFVQKDQWTPTLDGSTGNGFTYTHQIGWVYRQRLLVDVWFDVAWSATTATGNLFLDLPYLVAVSAEKPFVGVVQSSTFAYTGGTGIVINAIPNTYRGEFWNVGTGFATANQAVAAAGQVIGHVRYIGVFDER